MKSEVKVGDNHLQITRIFNAPQVARLCLLERSRALATMVGLQKHHQG